VDEKMRTERGDIIPQKALLDVLIYENINEHIVDGLEPEIAEKLCY
jgi:hypothetical protein